MNKSNGRSFKSFIFFISDVRLCGPRSYPHSRSIGYIRTEGFRGGSLQYIHFSNGIFNTSNCKNTSTTPTMISSHSCVIFLKRSELLPSCTNLIDSLYKNCFPFHRVIPDALLQNAQAQMSEFLHKQIFLLTLTSISPIEKIPGSNYTDNISPLCFVYNFPFTGNHLLRLGEPYVFSPERDIPFIRHQTHPNKYASAQFCPYEAWIHICLNF